LLAKLAEVKESQALPAIFQDHPRLVSSFPSAKFLVYFKAGRFAERVGASTPVPRCCGPQTLCQRR